MRFRMTYEEWNRLQCGDLVTALDKTVWRVVHTRAWNTAGGIKVLHSFEVVR